MKTMKITACVAAASGLLAATGLARAAEYASVISATPVTASVAVPRQACADVQRLVQPQPSGAGALVGAIAGGVLGNQFGHGFGRAAATGLGVVAGSSIGNQVEANNNPPVAVAGRDCRTVSQYQNRVVGYDVVYEYNGQRYSTRTASDPGPRLAIDVRPSGSSLDRLGPRSDDWDAPSAYAGAPAYADAPTYVEPPAPAYYNAAPAYYAPAPAYYAPAPAYYGPSAYIAPAVVGLGLGYWVGRSWHSGYRGGYGGGYRHWH